MSDRELAKAGHRSAVRTANLAQTVILSWPQGVRPPRLADPPANPTRILCAQAALGLRSGCARVADRLRSGCVLTVGDRTRTKPYQWSLGGVFGWVLGLTCAASISAADSPDTSRDPIRVCCGDRLPRRVARS